MSFPAPARALARLTPLPSLGRAARWALLAAALSGCAGASLKPEPEAPASASAPEGKKSSETACADPKREARLPGWLPLDPAESASSALSRSQPPLLGPSPQGWGLSLDSRSAMGASGSKAAGEPIPVSAEGKALAKGEAAEAKSSKAKGLSPKERKERAERERKEARALAQERRAEAKLAASGSAPENGSKGGLESSKEAATAPRLAQEGSLARDAAAAPSAPPPAVSGSERRGAKASKRQAPPAEARSLASAEPATDPEGKPVGEKAIQPAEAKRKTEGAPTASRPLGRKRVLTSKGVELR